MVQLNFDANQVEPAHGFEPIPAGKYLAAICGSEMKPTKNSTGQYLELEYTVLNGQFKGRKLWSRHNLENTNAQTVEIARAELSAICRSTGVMKFGDSAELHTRPLTIVVKQKKRADTGELTNEIVAWDRKDAVSGVPQQAAANALPWMKR
jgi:hypothetical protein